MRSAPMNMTALGGDKLTTILLLGVVAALVLSQLGLYLKLADLVLQVGRVIR